MSLWRPATFERALLSYSAKITMATIGQVKDLLKNELEPLHSKLETTSTEFSDDLLKQIKQSNEKLHQQRTDLSKTNFEVNNIKKDLMSMEERIANVSYEIEELGQCLRRDCLEMSGIKATSDCSAESIVQSVGKLLMFQLTNKIFLLRTLYRLTMLLFVLLPSGQGCPVEETNQMSRKTKQNNVLTLRKAIDNNLYTCGVFFGFLKGI